MYEAAENRYDHMKYRRAGRSGVLLPEVSLGLWQNFGLEKPLEEQRQILLRAFDLGLTHLIWQITMVLLPEERRRKTSARFWHQI